MRQTTRFVLLLTMGLVLAAAPPRAQGQVFIIQPTQIAGIAATTLTRNIVLLPNGSKQINFLINITNGGTATGTLQLFIEDSIDGGTTWDDLVSSLTFSFGAAAATQRFMVAGEITPSTITTAASTNITQGSTTAVETLAAGSARQGPFGDRVRVREKVSGPAGSPVGPTYTITAVVK